MAGKGDCNKGKDRQRMEGKNNVKEIYARGTMRKLER